MRSLKLSLVGEAALLVAILALGKPVLVPVALAFYFAFVLTPLAERLERLGVPRALSLLGVVGVAASLFAVLGALLFSQLVSLATQLQTYSFQITQKVASLKSGSMGPLASLSYALSTLSQLITAEVSTADHSSQVRLVQQDHSALQQLEATVRPVIEPLAFGGVVLVLTVFMLALREDLRGRLIQLLGPQNVTVTTRTMSEAVNRISHYLLTQAYINAGFGSVIALGLSFIGLPYALLWGAIAGLLRFVPLLGAFIAVLLPSLIAFAIFPGWRETGLTVLLFVVADVAVGNFIEPWVMGKRTGVSSLALLISTLFWTWLWGPLGLVLATPLTVCAAVVGRHVPRLSFLAIALGDEPGLSPSVDFYQRVLAGAKGDALRLVQRRSATSSLGESLDIVVRPSLMLMARDVSQQAIDDTTAGHLVKDIGEVIERLQSKTVGARPGAGLSVVGVPAETDADALLLKMLSVVSHQVGVSLEVLAVAPRSATVDELALRKPSVVCIGALPPGGSANARFLCRRLRAQLPTCHILVLLPAEVEAHVSETAARLREAGASQVVFTLREAAGAIRQAMS